MNFSALQVANDILNMQDRILDLEAQVEHLSWFKEEYHKLLESSHQHNAAMMGNILQLCLTPGVIEACKENKSFG
jgi:hypothetical protein